MGYKTTSTRCVLQCVCLMLLHLSCSAQDKDMRFSCKTVASDLVFVLDGSWSVGDVSFEIVKRWLVNITRSFNIGEKFTQVGVVQYSDNPKINIPLGEYPDSTDLITAMESIEYMGGNTRTGTAIQFATDKLFNLSERRPNGIARIAVVLTDGKSQDEVKSAAEEARKRGIIIFAIGVGKETEEAELVAIGNKPSSTYVFYVDDYTAISRIREIIRQKICEESVCPKSIPVENGDVKGFDVLQYLNLSKKVKKTQGSLHGTKAFQVTSKVDLSESTNNLFPDGLPPSYVFVSTLRYKGSVLNEKWDLWRIQTSYGEPQMAVTLNGFERNVMFTTTSVASIGTQTVVFQQAPAKKLFDENWHQLRLLVTEQDATLFVDDLEIEMLPLEPPVGIFINGKTQIGKYVSKETTVPFEIMKLRIYCDPEQNNRERACEIPGVCANGPGDIDVDPTPETCTCPPGPTGLPGIKGEEGTVGRPGSTGPAGADGKPGMPGIRGISGQRGPAGVEGRRGVDGVKGEQGRPGDLGVRGFPGLPGPLGQAGEKGSKGLRGEPGFAGKDGPVGAKGDTGRPGPVGQPGEAGLPGRNGQNGPPGQIGQKGQVGEAGIPGLDGRQGHPGMPGIPGDVGQSGTKGEAGFPGLNGVKGSPGTSGDNGLPGGPGPSGQPGTKGSKGEGGMPGQPGVPGNEGKSGEPGSAGQPGMPGLTGPKGQRGQLGERGEAGLKGGKGDKGIPGNHGSTGSLGPKGEKGTTGDLGLRGLGGHQGQPGLPGQTGPPGPRGQTGDVGPSGLPGLEGRPGREMSKQAIQQICREVLRMEMPSLFLSNQEPSNCDRCQTREGFPGAPGPVGPKGSRGFTGIHGSSGQPGHPGRPGRPGMPGLKGDHGIQGEKGNQGRTGFGDPGTPGPPGPMGPQGYSKSGHTGMPGPPGQNGVDGKRGNPGVPGPPGECHPTMCYGVMMRNRDHFGKGPN